MERSLASEPLTANIETSRAPRVGAASLAAPPAPVADVDDGEAGERVHQLLAALGPDPHPLGPVDDQLLVRQPGVILRLVGPEVSDRVGGRGRGARGAPGLAGG